MVHFCVSTSPYEAEARCASTSYGTMRARRDKA